MTETAPLPDLGPSLDARQTGSVVTLTLNRPELANAFDDQLIAALSRAFEWCHSNEALRVVVLRGAGRVFCAGADFRWMRRMVDDSFTDNLTDARRLAAMFEALDTLPQATLCRVQGAALGGGMGLVAACDLAVAEDQAQFGFPEVRIGLAPATIAPYVIRRLGAGRCRELFLTGRKFGAEEALRYGFLSWTGPAGELDAAVDKWVARLLGSGPRAIAACKSLIRNVEHAGAESVAGETAHLIAGLRVSEEGQAGLRAALARKRPGFAEETCSDGS